MTADVLEIGEDGGGRGFEKFSPHGGLREFLFLTLGVQDELQNKGEY